MRLTSQPSQRQAPIWMTIETYRACDLCMHVQAGQAERHCGHTSATRANGQLPVNQARASDGPCGPNANHMAAAGWQA